MEITYLIVLLLLIVVAQTTYLVVATSTKSKRSARHSIYVDTSVLIDGRILAIAEAGFVPGELVVPRSVVRELQLLADGGDSDKRAKARKGLDLIRELQSIDTVDVRIMQDGAATRGVDEQLIDLAKKYHGSICTVDYNLNKVARVEGVIVLNINELAKNIRAIHMPGERVMIEIVTKGQGANQGVGYLEDGTMVVVENASKRIGDEVEVEFIRVLQTDAGKMMFAKATTATASASPKQQRNPVQQIAKRVMTPKRAGGRGRKPQEASKPSQVAPDPVSAPTPTPAPAKPSRATSAKSDTKPSAQGSTRPARRQPRKRMTNEDSLINLIKDQ